MKKNLKINILDCTLRDGGYYNNWDFSHQLTQNYINKIHASGVRNIELGFRALKKGRVKGPNWYTSDTFINSFKIPKEIKITVEKQTIIKITGVDKNLVSKIAADIKNLKPVEPYKAKGIKERGQFVLRKEGKKK